MHLYYIYWKTLNCAKPKDIAFLHTKNLSGALQGGQRRLQVLGQEQVGIRLHHIQAELKSKNIFF